jgi:hypothetical protein
VQHGGGVFLCQKYQTPLPFPSSYFFSSSTQKWILLFFQCTLSFSLSGVFIFHFIGKPKQIQIVFSVLSQSHRCLLLAGAVSSTTTTPELGLPNGKTKDFVCNY